MYEASRIHGVKRVIFASSGGTMLGYELESRYTEIVAAEYDKVPKVWPLITDDMPARPNSLCYVSKVFGEVLGRMYSDQHGISVLNIRFGAVMPDDAPLMRRHYPGYLSHADAVQMVEKCIDALRPCDTTSSTQCPTIAGGGATSLRHSAYWGMSPGAARNHTTSPTRAGGTRSI